MKNKSNKALIEAEKKSFWLINEDVANILTCFDTLNITTACLASHEHNPFYNLILFKPPKFNHILFIGTEMQYEKIALCKEWHFGELCYNDVEQKFTLGYTFTAKRLSVNEIGKFLDLSISEFIFEHFLREKILYKHPYCLEEQHSYTDSYLEFTSENIYMFAEKREYVIDILRDNESLLKKMVSI